MSKKEYVTSNIQVNSSDMLLIQMMNAKVMQFADKFVFKDITRDNLTYLAKESTHIAKSLVNGHQFFNFSDQFFYELKYISVQVNNSTKEVDLKPYFVRRGKIC